MSRGSLIYSTPRNGLPQKLFSVLFTGLCWFTAGAVMYLAIIGEIAFNGNGSSILHWFVLVILILILVGSPLLMAHVMLNPRFRIFGHGITEPKRLFQSLKAEERFIPFSEMKAYQRSKKKGSQIVVLFLPRSECIDFYDTRKRVLDTLEDELRRHGIARMPDECPSCGQAIFTYSRLCSKCKSSLVGEDV